MQRMTIQNVKDNKEKKMRIKIKIIVIATNDKRHRRTEADEASLDEPSRRKKGANAKGGNAIARREHGKARYVMVYLENLFKRKKRTSKIATGRRKQFFCGNESKRTRFGQFFGSSLFGWSSISCLLCVCVCAAHRQFERTNNGGSWIIQTRHSTRTESNLPMMLWTRTDSWVRKMIEFLRLLLFIRRINEIKSMLVLSWLRFIWSKF